MLQLESSGKPVRCIAVLLLLLTLGSATCAGFSQADDYARAIALVRAHQWDASLAILGPLLKIEPRNLQYLNLAGLALTGKGEVRRADQYFSKSLAINPQFLPALKNLAINEFNSGDLRNAGRHLSLALEQAPGDPVANLYAGQLAYKEQHFAAVVATLPRAQPFLASDANLAAQLAVSYLAVAQTQKAIHLLASIPAAQLNAESQFTLGVKLAGAGLYEQAVPYLLAASGRQEESYNAAFDLALCYLDLKQYAEAESVLNETILRGGESSELDNLLAEVYENHRQTQKAIDSLRRAIALAPEDESNYLDFASICIDHQDYAAAERVLDLGLQMQPASDRLFFQRGILHAVQDNFELAEQDFKKAAALSPEKNSTYKGLGILYLESGNASEAISTLKRRLQEKPDDPDLLYLLGEALLRAGAQPGTPPYHQAQVAFERSVELDPKACLPHVSLGKIYLQQDRTQDAVSQLEQARAADPREKSTYWQLANAYRKLGQSEKQKWVLAQLKSLNDQERSGSRAMSAQAEGSAKTPEANPD